MAAPQISPLEEMENLFRHDSRACRAICPDGLSRPECSVYCGRAAAVNSQQRGFFFNVPFQQPPLESLNSGVVNEVAWATLGTDTQRAPWRAAALAAPPPRAMAQPPAVLRPPSCGMTDGLQGTFYGWNQVPDALWQPSFAQPIDEVFARASNVNQALSGYLVDPRIALASDGPLSNQKPTDGNSAGQLPRADPFGGVGFNLSQNVPYNSLANVYDQPTLFARSRYDGQRSMQLANLSA